MTKSRVHRIGYGTITALLVIASIEAYRVQGNVAEAHIDIYRKFVHQEETITDLRRTVWLAGSVVREYFIRSTPETAARLRQQLRELRADSDRCLRHLDRKEIGATGRASLEEGINEFWTTLEAIPDTMMKGSAEEKYDFVQNEMVPRRSTLYTALRRLSDADKEALQRSEAEFAEARRAAAKRLLVILGICIALALLVARATMAHIDGLEKTAERQFGEMAAAKAELQQLSARLLEVEEEDRKHLARELHDEIGQNLAVLQIEISHCNALLGGGQPELRQRLQRARERAEASVQAVRNISLLLRPALLDDLGLAAALEWLVESFSKRNHVPCELTSEGVDEHLPDGVKTCVYRIAQEALHNCEKHAGAHRVKVRLRGDGVAVRLEVEDDGRGFDPRVPGLGTLGMRERAGHLGGTVTIETRRGEGSKVSVMLPLDGQRIAAAARTAEAR